MRIFHDAFRAGRWASGAVVTIGKFDGLHLGHRRVIRRAAARARALKTRCLLITFDPTPAEYFGGGPARPLLARALFLKRLGAMGVNAVVFLPFNRQLACLGPGAFARDVLAQALRVREVVVGADFCFGKDRAGRVRDLEGLGADLGFAVRPVELLRRQGEKVSSSRVRRLLAEGRPDEARRLLEGRRARIPVFRRMEAR